jgi:hypothetical protein
MLAGSGLAWTAHAELPDAAAAVLAKEDRASRAGEFAAVAPTLEELIGRPPARIESVLR